ncbi:NAD(P)-binding protein [Schizopora paradoxa]|uniref:NAD(P)-binding protein n=1 Tax=Schizopora paradoxa TaxID=27342 RepID=A0A0H2RSA8_9AGAM|nr:NAD(P)-binding protein [Schizopora paradoxa]
MSKTAIVTGAAQGIGRSIALRLAADGMNVSLNDLPANLSKLQELASEINNSKSSKASEGAIVHIVTGDISKAPDVQNLIKETVSVFGSLDVMIANAGILVMQQIQDVVEEDWDKLISINLRGAMLCVKYAAQQMILQGKGGCILGLYYTFPSNGTELTGITRSIGHAAGSAYSASKFAVRGLVQSSALDLGKHQIRVNCYAPGFIDTEMSRKAMDIVQLDFQQTASAASPLARIGETTDVSNLVSFLASSQASFITGQTYGVCGGFYLD